MDELMFDRINEIACDSYAFAEFDVDGEPHPRLAEISGAYLVGSITREEYRAKMEEALEELSKEAKNK